MDKKRLLAILIGLVLAALSIAPAFAQSGVVWGN